MTDVRYPIKNILDIPIWGIKRKQIPPVLASFIASGKKHTSFYVNAHCINVSSTDSYYKKILQDTSIVYSGGIGPVLASKLLGRSLPQRAPTPDFIEDVFTLAQKRKWSIYLLGTKEKSLQIFMKKMEQKFPKLLFCGYHHGFFTKDEEEGIIQEINTLKPTIVIVGMGTPKQEKWIATNMARADAKLFWAVGALFDVMAGVLPRAPKWVQAIGLEWLYRFFQEPKRLWRRYLIGNSIFIARVFLSLIPNRPLHKFSLRLQ